MNTRRITKANVANAITKPDTVIEVRSGRKQAVKTIQGKEISAVYVEQGGDVVVITVFWGR